MAASGSTALSPSARVLWPQRTTENPVESSTYERFSIHTFYSNALAAGGSLSMKKAKHYHKKYRQIYRTEIRMVRMARFYVLGEHKSALVIRIRAINGVSPKVQKICRGTFVKFNKASVDMLRIVEPYILNGGTQA
ncbi:hypothetical protein GH733_013304 [Mirounga leonina]|nr:hypothetical protein GH733_013304 [Mirounga leonina]